LLLEIDRLAWRRVVDLQGFAAVTWRSGHWTGGRETARHTQGEGAGAPRGVARSFWTGTPSRRTELASARSRKSQEGDGARWRSFYALAIAYAPEQSV